VFAVKKRVKRLGLMLRSRVYRYKSWQVLGPDVLMSQICILGTFTQIFLNSRSDTENLLVYLSECSNIHTLREVLNFAQVYVFSIMCSKFLTFTLYHNVISPFD